MPAMKQNNSDHDRSIQVYSALSVGVVCLVIGLPLWWKTTEVYRVSLPYSDISSLTDSKIYSTVDVEVISLVKEIDLAALSKKLTASLVQDGDIILNYRVSVQEATAAIQGACAKPGLNIDIELHVLYYNSRTVPGTTRYSTIFLTWRLKGKRKFTFQQVLDFCLDNDDEDEFMIPDSDDYGGMLRQSGQALVDYEKMVNLTIENAYKKNLKSVQICDSKGKTYVVDFGNMEEYDQQNPSDKVKIIRRDLIKDTSFESPAHWAPMTQNENLKVVNLAATDPEYLKVYAEIAPLGEKS
ncbi:hypothetical protein ScPMuIL_001183 [Solemya velum]